MKLDVFNHLFPEKFYKRMLEVAPRGKDMHKRVREIPCIVDLKERFRIMDQFGEDYAQVISLPSPPIEVFGPPAMANELARLANDGMAELVKKYPKRFPAFVASLPMNDPKGLLREAKRAIQDLGAAGVQVFTNVLGAPLTTPQALPLFELMAKLDRPIWMHPARGAETPDYRSENKSHYEIWWTLGWPYETSVAMAHIVFEGLFDRYPDLKIITHHMGGMIPYFEGRVGPGWDQLGKRTSDVDYTKLLRKLKKRPLDYFRMFYADTALFGAWEATKCGLKFFGTDRVLLASDAPFDPQKGSMYTRTTIEIIERLDLSPAERHAIYEGNARRLMRIAAYGVGKRTAEFLCSHYARKYGIETKIARCFAFIGPYLPLDAHFAVGNFIRDGLAGGPIKVQGDGSPYRSYLYAADLAIWLWTILFKGVSGLPYNVGSEQAITIGDLASKVAQAYHPPLEVHIAQPRRAGEAPERYVPATRRARLELGLKENVGLQEAINRTIEWHRGLRQKEA